MAAASDLPSSSPPAAPPPTPSSSLVAGNWWLERRQHGGPLRRFGCHPRRRRQPIHAMRDGESGRSRNRGVKRDREEGRTLAVWT